MSAKPHVGFARKHRPQRFEDLIGQEAASVTLQNAVGSSQTGHAYLFFGPRGVGKTTSARLLAKALNCKTGPTPNPCGKCPSCQEIAAGTSIDVLELDAASNTQVDKIREMIIETVRLAPSRDRCKIFIVDEAHMLSTSSFNALLKTLEEPPEHAVFILATTELSKIPATIVSRCQRFRFKPVPREMIVEHLKRVAKAEGIKADPSALAMLAKASGGALRDALGLFEQAASFQEGALTAEGVGELLGTLPADAQAGVLGAVFSKDAKALHQWLGKIQQDGFDAAQLLRDIRDRLRDMHLHRLGISVELDEPWTSLCAGQSPEALSFLLGRVNQTLERLRSAESPQIVFELGLFGMIEAAYDLKSLVSRLEALERRLSQDGAPAPAPAAASRVESAPVPSVPAAQPAQVQAVKPVSAATPDFWPAVLDRIFAEMPGLGASLEAARLVRAEGSEWTLVFSQAFSMERALEQKSMIEKCLSDALGAAVVLSFKVEKAAPPPVKTGSVDGWADAGEGDAAADDPGLKKVLGIMGGKVRSVKKKER